MNSVLPATTPQEDFDAALKGYSKLLDRLNKEARRDRCPGDICCGWDWPTLRVVKPKEYAQLMGFKSQARKARQTLRSAGLWEEPKN